MVSIISSYSPLATTLYRVPTLWKCVTVYLVSVSIACRERLCVETERTGELLAELGSDQTSCHNPFNGGYYPVQVGLLPTTYAVLAGCNCSP